MITFSDLGKKEFQELDTLASRDYLKEHYKAQITSQKNSIYLHWGIILIFTSVIKAAF